MDPVHFSLLVSLHTLNMLWHQEHIPQWVEEIFFLMSYESDLPLL